MLIREHTSLTSEYNNTSAGFRLLNLGDFFFFFRKIMFLILQEGELHLIAIEKIMK